MYVAASPFDPIASELAGMVNCAAPPLSVAVPRPVPPKPLEPKSSTAPVGVPLPPLTVTVTVVLPVTVMLNGFAETVTVGVLSDGGGVLDTLPPHATRLRQNAKLNQHAARRPALRTVNSESLLFIAFIGVGFYSLSARRVHCTSGAPRGISKIGCFRAMKTRAVRFCAECFPEIIKVCVRNPSSGGVPRGRPHVLTGNPT